MTEVGEGQEAGVPHRDRGARLHGAVARDPSPFARDVARWADRARAFPGNAVRGVASEAWGRTASYRRLLNADPSRLSRRERLQRRLTILAHSLLDPHHRRLFRRFGRALEGAPGPIRVGPGSGVAAMIGSLGPGGAERQLVLTMSGMGRRGIAPLRVTCCWLREEAHRFFLRDLEAAGVTVGELARGEADAAGPGAAGSSAAFRELPASLREVSDFARSLAKDPPRVLHLWLDEVNIKGGLAAVALGIPRIVLGVRSLPPFNYLFFQPYMREAYRWLARREDVVLVANSAAGAKAYERWLGLPSATIRVVRNGFSFTRGEVSCRLAARDGLQRRYGLSATEPIVGTVMRLSEEKRPLLFLEAAAQVRKRVPGAQFLIVGDGVLRGEVERRAACDDLRGAVHLAGHEKDPFGSIAAMDLFVLTSRAEGLPNVLIEAQALGVPVVTTDAGGAAEAVRNGVTGWVLERDDPRDVAERIATSLGDEAWLARARAEGPRFVESAFGLARMLDETLAVYGSAVMDPDEGGQEE